jgi:gliding motility-associated-like protein
MVTWTVTDLHGNSDTCQEEVIITDNELPVITCPADITVNNDTGKCTAAVTIGASQATDNCGIASLTNDAPALFPVGRTIVTWTATDIHGNTNTCQQTITVKDVTLPDIYCRPDVSVNNDPGKCYATIILAPPLADDNCGIASLTNNAPALFPVGSTVVTWTVIDLSGNTAICVQNVTVTDIENPNIQPPADISTHTDRGEFYATVNLGTPVTADNCGIASVTNNAPLKFQIGLTRVTWTVVDVHGHSDSAVQFVTVSPVLPTAIDDYDTTNMNFPITINYMANDINPAGNTLNTIICRNPAHGTMKIEGDSLIVYTPDAGYKGPDLIQYSLYDAFLKGASDTATIHILVGAEVPIFIPNAITPNGDGFNDTWIITGIDGFPSNNVTVFNRWGDEIISLDAYDNKSVVWAGNNEQGNRVADGTYFYVVNIDGVGKFKGWIFVRANSQ